MTDEQFDDICRSALAFESGMASAAIWSRIRLTRWNWLPTIPEILACGCACALVLCALGVGLNQTPATPGQANSVVQRAMGRPLAGLQASTFEVPTPWTEASLALPAAAPVLKTTP